MVFGSLGGSSSPAFFLPFFFFFAFFFFFLPVSRSTFSLKASSTLILSSSLD